MCVHGEERREKGVCMLQYVGVFDQGIVARIFRGRTLCKVIKEC